MTKAKLFLQAITLVNEDFLKAKSVLTDKRLSQLEKQIIQAYVDLRDNRFSEIIPVLINQKSEDVFVESQRNILLGLAYNNSGDLKLARPFFEIAWDIVKTTNYKTSQFIVLYNLFTLHRNLKQIERMSEYLDLMQELEIKDHPGLFLMLLRCRFCYYSYVGDMMKAKSFMLKIERRKEELGENQILSFQIDKFDFYLKNDQYSDCYKTLEEMKKFRIYASSFNFKFMKILLDHITLEKPIYAYDKDFINVPILYNMLNVVKALEAADPIEALKWWGELTLISPDIYQADFIYKGDKCLFSVAYQMHRQNDEKIIILENVKEKTKEELLLKILENSKHPVRKDQIYKMIWGEELQDKEGLLKLSKLVWRVKKKFNIEIKTRKGCYYTSSSSLIKLKKC
ncbi:MAG: hypothetical protein ACOYL6_16840 [Bacteriovoracaceae bacterium]